MTVGGDAIFGKGEGKSHNFQYYAALDGSRRDGSADGTPVEDAEFEAERTFLGAPPPASAPARSTSGSPAGISGTGAIRSPRANSGRPSTTGSRLGAWRRGPRSGSEARRAVVPGPRPSRHAGPCRGSRQDLAVGSRGMGEVYRVVNLTAELEQR
jgi:hypothetical protein